MKHLTLDMPIVTECAVNECAYNISNKCHARAITIGDSLHAGCDTFLASAGHTKATQRTAGVGACKSVDCKFNDDFECITDQIRVGHAAGGVNCLTYAPK